MKASPMDFCCFKWINKIKFLLLLSTHKIYLCWPRIGLLCRKSHVIFSSSLSCTMVLYLYWWIRSEQFSLINFIKSLIWYSLFWKTVLLALWGKKNKIGHSSFKFQNAVNYYFRACSNNFGDETLKKTASLTLCKCTTGTNN